MQSPELPNEGFSKGMSRPVDNAIEAVHNSQSGPHVITLTPHSDQQFSMLYPANEQLLVRTISFSYCVFCACYIVGLIIGTYAGVNTWLLTLAFLTAFWLWIKRCGQLTNYDYRPSKHERRIERFDVS